MKIREITEMTSSGSVASIATPMGGTQRRGKYGAPEAAQKKNKDGTIVNALDMPDNIFGHQKKR